MHETTRKRICRWAFFVFCLVPTAATVAWAAYENRPDARADVARELSRQLRLEVSLAAIETPRPGVIEIPSVRLRRWSEAASVVLGQVRVRRTRGRALITVQHIDGDAAAISWLATSVAAWLSESQCDAVEFRAETVTIRQSNAEDSESLRLSDLNLRVAAEPPAGDGETVVRVSAAVGEMQRPLQLSIGRAADGTVEAKLEVTATPLPMWLVARMSPLEGFAPRARFTGVIGWFYASPNLSGSFKGSIDGFDLADLLPEGSMHTARGAAELHMDVLQFADQRIERLNGVLTSNGGELSGSLLATAVHLLLCPQPEFALEPLHSFDALALQCELDGRGFTISSSTSASTKDRANLPVGCLLCYDGKPLLREPRAREFPVAFLAQAAVGLADQRMWLPANDGAVELMRRLPRPSVAVGAPAAAISPKSR